MEKGLESNTKVVTPCFNPVSNMSDTLSEGKDYSHV